MARGLLAVLHGRVFHRCAVQRQQVIAQLTVGMRVLLPSGNILLLVRRERSMWVCSYTQMARQRGEVEFTGAWLRRWAQRV